VSTAEGQKQPARSGHLGIMHGRRGRAGSAAIRSSARIVALRLERFAAVTSGPPGGLPSRSGCWSVTDRARTTARAIGDQRSFGRDVGAEACLRGALPRAPSDRHPMSGWTWYYAPMPQDYFKEIDLNPVPALGGIVNNPLDPRAMHFFGFTAEGQDIQLVNPISGVPRVAVSWQFANQPPRPRVRPSLRSMRSSTSTAAAPGCTTSSITTAPT